MNIRMKSMGKVTEFIIMLKVKINGDVLSVRKKNNDKNKK
jgi:hypothetical protein